MSPILTIHAQRGKWSRSPHDLFPNTGASGARKWQSYFVSRSKTISAERVPRVTYNILPSGDQRKLLSTVVVNMVTC